MKDFAPVAGVAAMPHVLVVRKDFEAKSVGDVVAMAKAKPGALTFGSMGNGSGAHLAGELFKTKAGIDMLHVPLQGARADDDGAAGRPRRPLASRRCRG